MIIKENFSKFKDNSRRNCTFLEFQEFSRTKVIFKVCANPEYHPNLKPSLYLSYLFLYQVVQSEKSAHLEDLG